jgi:hypothetical protein
MSIRCAVPVTHLLAVLALIPALPVVAADVNGTLALDPIRLSGVDDLGRMLLYAPDPLEGGSSISHWDRSATPDLLMEPSASPLVPVGELDLTVPQMRDSGWPEGTSQFRIRVRDGNDEGFNDPTVVDAAPDNPGGTTLGGQRLAAMQWAARIWEAQLGSGIEVNIEASFGGLDCEENESAVLAETGVTFLFLDFPNAPRQNTWYHGALAESLANENLSNTEDGFPPDDGDLTVQFNSRIDEGCLAEDHRFYYGLDGNTPQGQASFTMVALHEMGHGLGFRNFVNPFFGTLLSFPSEGIPPTPDIYTVFTFDKDLQLHWDVMSNAQRRASAVNTNRVVWDGPNTTEATVDFLDRAPTFTVNWPRYIAGSYLVQRALFGPPIELVGVTGGLAVVNDGSGARTLGCNALVNGAEIAGKIAVVDRGECLFTQKVKNAQNAGAVAVLVVNNRPDEFVMMGGSDPTITIPSAHISQANGELIKSALEPGGALRGVRRLAPVR